MYCQANIVLENYCNDLNIYNSNISSVDVCVESLQDRLPLLQKASAFLSLLVLVLLGVFHHQHKDPAATDLRSIPGPRWYIPYLGSLTFIGRRWFESLANLRRSYGDVYLLRIGTRPVVLLNGFKTIHKALVGGGDEEFETYEQSRQRAKSFSGRPALHTFQLASRGRSMSFNSYSNHWKQHRRLADRAMREMNENQTFWKDVVCKEAAKLKDTFLSKVGQEAFDPKDDVMWSVARVKYGLCYGGTDKARQVDNETDNKTDKEGKTSATNTCLNNVQGVIPYTETGQSPNNLLNNVNMQKNRSNSNMHSKLQENNIKVLQNLNLSHRTEAINNASGKEVLKPALQDSNNSLPIRKSELYGRIWNFISNYFRRSGNRDRSDGSDTSMYSDGIRRASCSLIGGRRRCSLSNRNISSNYKNISTNDIPTAEQLNTESTKYEQTERSDEEDFRDMVDHTMRLIDCHSKGNVIDFFPWARALFSHKIRSLEELCAEMLSITERKHRQHLNTYTEGSVRDLQDALIKHGLFNKRCLLTDSNQIMMTVQEYIGAGLDIIQAALHWMLLYLVNHPHIQARIQQEIDREIGRERAPCQLDVTRLRFTEAFVLEVLRHASVVPLALPHSTIDDTNINGIKIPRDTFIMVNLHSVNHDSELWENPGEFRPERHLPASLLDKTGASETRSSGTGSGEIGPNETESDRTEFDATENDRWGHTSGRRSVQWGLGRRRCVGEEFSRAELVIYVSTLLQSCSLHWSRDLINSQSSYSIEPKLGIVLKPRDFKIVVTAR